ncbi:hypothetical protein SAMN04489859_103141 [Paracoccus alcaliphilus]|uniref:PH domain-containing protein n=1 Tax=Paracoccus alcaliphilus TaxID=34002 RepID=A0A1H8LJW6_9RHOB|nr:hypothetical protein [Paracoccus alcaliphilus]WCR19735.1 hypothetical protein JHW40_08900 [Paracoccus alcaliphilus]SEO05460.1 hypothetical protein SAMN04489859_103141 [Paracoccus alcaliphilus]
MIRPDLRDWLGRHSEPLVAGAILLAGIWVLLRGGWFFGVLGGLAALVGASLLIGALRRMAFRRDIASPGVVEVDEGAIRYYGAQMLGGEIGLNDLVEIRLLSLNGHAHWRLRNQQGEALLIPTDAAGAEGLAHAFTALPDLDMGTVTAGLQMLSSGRATMRTVWMRRI